MIGDSLVKPLKKALTYQEQIEHLTTSHKLSISDPAYAKTILSRVNYYRLSAYGIGLCEDDGETFRQGVCLETLHGLYEFDAKLRNLLFPIIEEIEVSIRTKIAYYIGVKYGAEGYVNAGNFILKTNKRGEPLFDKFIGIFEREKRSQGETPIVKHHEDVYGGHYPVWVAVELLSFGTLSMLYSILIPSDKKNISSNFKVGHPYFESWLISLVEVRNLCAHYCRLYNRPLTKAPRLFPEHKGIHSDRIFPTIFMMGYLLENKNKWRVFVQDLINLIGAYPDVNLHFIGFPNNWVELMTLHPRGNG